jgi:hypothetical protein
MHTTIMTLVLLFSGMAHAKLERNYKGTLDVKKPLSLSVNKKGINLKEGTYPAQVLAGYSDGFLGFGSRPTATFKVQTDKGARKLEIKFEKKSKNKLEEQRVLLTDSSAIEQGVPENGLSEVRSCVFKEWYTEENCRIVYDRKCDIFGENCTTEPRIQC